MYYNIPQNITWSTITKLSNGLMLILLIIAGRVLGDRAYGDLSIVIAFVYLFENLTDLGLSEIALRDISRDNNKGNRYIGNLIIWKSLLCCAVFLVIFSLCQVIPYSSEIIYGIYLFTLSAFFKSFKYCFLAFFKANNRYGLEAFSVTLERSLVLFFGLIILAFSPSLIHLMWVFFWVRLVDVLVTLYIMNKSILKPTLMFDFRFIKTLQLKALPLGIYVYTAFLYGYVDTFMLSFIKGSAEVGWYNAAYRIYDGLIILPFIFHYGLLPPLSKYFFENKEKHLLLSGEMARYALIIALPLSVVLAQNAGPIIHLLFGNEFEQAVPDFKILMIGLFFTYLIVIFNCILISMDRLKPILFLSVCGLIVNVISNFMLIPKFGHLGAALSTAFSEIVVFSITMMYLGKICNRLKLTNQIARLSLVVAVVVLMLFLCIKLGASAAFLVGICTITYAICLVLLKLIDPRRVSFILKTLVPFKS